MSSKPKKTSQGLLDWFERKGLEPTGDSKKDLATFKRLSKTHQKKGE